MNEDLLLIKRRERSTKCVPVFLTWTLQYEVVFWVESETKGVNAKQGASA